MLLVAWLSGVAESGDFNQPMKCLVSMSDHIKFTRCLVTKSVAKSCFYCEYFAYDCSSGIAFDVQPIHEGSTDQSGYSRHEAEGEELHRCDLVIVVRPGQGSHK